MKNTVSDCLWDKLITGQLGNLVAGPCAVESVSQLESVAIHLKEKQVKILRAGAYKPRTSPKTFQGLGRQG